MTRPFKTLSVLAVVAMGVVAPVKVRVGANADGLPCSAGISLSANEVGAQGICWCEYQQYASGCTSPDYKVVCAASLTSKSGDVYPIEDTAWLLSREAY